MIKHIAFTLYPVTDMARARAFYEGALGLALWLAALPAWPQPAPIVVGAVVSETGQLADLARPMRQALLLWQEERNAAILLERQAAVRCNDVEILAHKIDDLLENPDRLARLQANARNLARPRAAIPRASPARSSSP